MAKAKVISPKKKVKLMKVGEMVGFSQNIEEVRQAIASTDYRFTSEYQGSTLVLIRTA